MNRRCPPGVVKTSIFPESAHRRSVSGSTPRIRLAAPIVRFCRSTWEVETQRSSGSPKTRCFWHLTSRRAVAPLVPGRPRVLLDELREVDGVLAKGEHDGRNVGAVPIRGQLNPTGQTA